MKKQLLYLFLVIILSGCASQKPLTLDQVSFRVVKVNKFMKMQSLRGEGFEVIGRKHPNEAGILKNDLPFEERGEEFVVIWRYDGPALKNVPVKLCFDYTYGRKPEVFRVAEKYTDVFPGRYTFKFCNKGNDYYKHGEIENWRVTIYYGTCKVAQKKSAFFGKS